jgi:two-component system, LytTR family, sensor kinase
MENRATLALEGVDPHVPVRAALLSIIGFWLFQTLVVTLRAAVIDIPAQDELALRRIFVTLCGIVITLFVWLILRKVEGKPLGWRVATAALACLPAAFLIALANYYFFNLYDPDSLLDLEVVRAELGTPGKFILELTEVAISRYFFLIAWAALYLALGYAYQARQVERRAAIFEQAAQKAELRALRYQLNPHFLFNTLNSLSALVMANRRDDAEAMIMNLASFYRANLSSDASGDVPLGDEIAVQRLYLDIESVRFPDRLKVLIDLPAPLEEVQVPGLILQPLIENAIKHGVARTSKPVEIRITAREAEGQLILSVTDDAPKSVRQPGSGIGLTNVRDRLQARYGSAAQLDLREGKKGGFEVHMSLPLSGARSG